MYPQWDHTNQKHDFTNVLQYSLFYEEIIQLESTDDTHAIREARSQSPLEKWTNMIRWGPTKGKSYGVSTTGKEMDETCVRHSVTKINPVFVQ